VLTQAAFGVGKSPVADAVEAKERAKNPSSRVGAALRVVLIARGGQADHAEGPLGENPKFNSYTTFSFLFDVPVSSPSGAWHSLRKQDRLTMNRIERRPADAGEAKVEYLDGDFRIVRPGAFVRCAITGQAIPLDELRYWNVERQEAYAGPAASMQRESELRRSQKD
jgi:hypothetical protein